MNFGLKNSEKSNFWCRPKKKLGAAWILVGLCFLFNPEVMLLDLLPDFIGYAFLLFGIYRLAELSPKLSDAFRGFRWLMFLSAAQTLIFYLLAFKMTQSEQPTGFLLWVFVFLVVGLFVGLPAWQKFFDGLLYLGLRHEGQALLARPGKKERKDAPGEKKQGGERSLRILSLQRLTYVFLILKSLFPLLAEWSVLSMYDHQEDYRVRNWYEFIDLYRGFVVLFGVVIGVIWLGCMLKYFRSVLRDEPFWKRLEDMFAETVMPDEALFVKRRIKWGFILLVTGLALRTEFYLDNANVIPEWLAPVAIAAGTVILWRFLSRKTALLISLGVYSASGIAVGATSRAFFKNFKSITEVSVNEDAAAAHRLICVLTGVEQLIFAGVLACLCLSLIGLIRSLTGFPPKCEEMPDRTFEIQHGETVRLWLVFVPFVLAAASSVCFRIFQPTIGSLWLLQVVMSVVLTTYLGYTLSSIYAQVERRYLFIGPGPNE